jgi:PilZ domain
VQRVNQRGAVLLKYRFGDLSQMNNHLHVTDGRTLFFYREPRPALETGVRVVMELSLADSEQVTTLRGAVLARANSEGSTGVWLEFPDSRLARRIDSGGAAAIANRHQRRLGCDLMVEMKFGPLPLLGRMVDVSLGGTRVLGAGGLRVGTDIHLRIMGAQPPMPNDLGTLQVARSENGGDIGLRFPRTDTQSRVASHKLFQAVQLAWVKAAEAMHPAMCCQNGQVLEPPMPHTRGLRD